jgi:hypothetical protein
MEHISADDARLSVGAGVALTVALGWAFRLLRLRVMDAPRRAVVGAPER